MKGAAEDAIWSLTKDAALIAVLQQHLPVIGANPEVEWGLDALLLQCLGQPKTPLVFDPAEEMAKLKMMRQAVDDLVCLWAALHTDVQLAFSVGCDKSAAQIPNIAAPSFNYVERIMAPIVRAGVHGGESMAKLGWSPGRVRSWRAIAIVGWCRTIWEDRTGQPAPRRLNPESPFADFLRDVFEVLDIEVDPESAVKAWRRQVDNSRGNPVVLSTII